MEPSQVKLIASESTEQGNITQIYNFQITDDSMMSMGGISFPPDAYIGVDFLRIPKHQDFVIAKVSQEQDAIFRQLIIKNNKLFLHPLNPSYPDITMKKESIIYAVVCHLITIY